MSCEGNLLDAAYARQAVQLARQIDSVVGVVCQTELPAMAPLLAFVPGIAPDAQTDGQGQF